MSEVKNIPEGWVESSLSEIALVNPRESISKGSIATNIPMDCIDSFSKKIQRYYSKGFEGGTKFRNGDTLLARITPCLENGKTAFVDILYENEIGFGSTEYLVFREIKEKSDKHFIYYLSISPRFREIAIKAMSGTSGRQRVQTDMLINHKFYLPKYEEQKSIAAILTAFDDKIELLQAQNKTLEETAQTIFAEWFGKYQIEDELPDGWRVGKLSEIANLKSGFAFKAEDFIEESNYKAIKIKDLKGNGNISLTDVSAITEEITKLDRVQYFKLNEGDILLAMSGNTTGKIGVLPSSDNEIYLNQRVGKFFMKQNKYNSFLYNFLMSGSFEEKILAMGYGSAQPNINPSQIENIEIIYPDETKMIDYLNISNPIFEKVLKNNTQIQTLTKTRDELLPRLMSGAVRVNEFKK
ncbi:restriction endonuclease subunit S [Flavobacterium crassostreae]|uniref:Type I restriction modification DNA specificity domain-containing protein n=1 Tax=Flavobacterium crassostreae TaxID=1763534 RepID=A0A1B9EA98_9FLAO|nr:restriction endonuclease subunit S [Flavobacterium crassostreae]OCB78862.1 hypothetical protein LPBF_00310 [Flavobacterium crassostreae]